MAVRGAWKRYAAEADLVCLRQSLTFEWQWKLDRPDGDQLETVCPRCHDKVSREEAGYSWSPCSCINDALSEAEEKFWDERCTEIVKAHEKAAGFPTRFASATFDDFEDREGTEEAAGACYDYAVNFALKETRSGLILIGPWGSGKTMLAVATARFIIEGDMASVLFLNVPELLLNLRASFDEKNNTESNRLLEEANTCELLVLDDLGQARATDWSRDVLHGIIDARYQRCLPLIVTSNCGAKELKELLGGATVSRLYEVCKPLVLTATDYRQAHPEWQRTLAGGLAHSS